MEKLPKVMVCVTRQKNCARLIKKGKVIANNNNANLYVVHVAKEGTNFLGNPNEGEALDYLFQLSKNVGADMSVLRANSIINALTDFANKNDVSIVVMGESPNLQGNIIHRLEQSIKDTNIKIITA